jgi:hypothetical protein
MTTVKPKANSVVSTLLDGRTLVFSVKHGEEVLTTRLDISKLHASICEKALIHGLKQRVSDRAAIPFDAKTGKYASPLEKFQAMDGLVQHLNSGTEQWDMARVAGDGIGRSYLLNALCELYATRTREDLAAWLKTLTDAQRKALELNDRVKPKIEAQRARVVQDIDTDDLLSGLES